jgi:hypothetical protein
VQGNIAAWRKAEGDSVAPGDILAEIETDKATIEWEAQEEGFIAKILKPAGQSAHSIGSFKQRGGGLSGGVCVFLYRLRYGAVHPAASAFCPSCTG